jgi:cytochrome P450
VTLGGTAIPAGEVVLVSLTSANRDPDRFADPDLLDLDRAAAGHVSFGHGIHHCVGAPLARLEAEVALRRLLDRYPGASLAADPATLRRRISVTVNGLLRLPVRLA